MIAKDFGREIDAIFVRYGYDQMVPPMARYLLLVAFCCTPIVLLFVLICCCDDTYPPEIPKKVAPLVPGPNAKKSTEKIE
jgi:hypothetical protein